MSWQRDVLDVLREPVVAEEDLRQRLLAILLAPPRRRMTYQEFLAWADEDTLAEWEDGEVVMYSPASRRHQEIGGFLYQILQIYAETHGLGVVLPPPFQMKLDRGVEPDLLFVAQDHLDRLRETHLDGPADLVVEIVSPESAERDRGTKFYEYARGGVPEYWLIDPQDEWAEFYHLQARSRYYLQQPEAEGIYRSRVLPGFWLRVAWLWQPPPVLDVLRELGLLHESA